MIRPSRRCNRAALLLWVAQASACAGEGFVSAKRAGAGGRAPSGVVVDPPSELPRAALLADASEGVLSLVPPASDRAAIEVVRAFFDAITRENLDVLSTLLTPDATVPNPAHGPASALLDHWRARMNHLRYQPLANEALYDESRVESYHFHDWDAGLAGRPARPADMLASDILVRVPMQIVRSGNERLFADEVVFLLRRHKDTLAIAEQIEDFPLQ